LPTRLFVAPARKHPAARRPREPIEVMIVCRSELLLMGLERLLVREPGLIVFTYSKLPVPAAEAAGEPGLVAEEPPWPAVEGEAEAWSLAAEELRRRRAQPGAPPRVAVLSDRGVPDIAADCGAALASLADEVVLLSSRPDISDMLSAMGAGVRSFATEGEGPDVLVAAIRSAARRSVYLSRRILEPLVEWLAERERPAGQARRERENDLLRLLAEGRSTSEIADLLGIAPKTVRNRISKLYRRLGVHSRSAAVRLAEERGMLDPGDRGL
jgi:DNA-binding NarL/FixJ family response regulator